ncbi:MAG TPA: hypothetical protein VI875_00225 [Candidatus Norongarragalinales archaeon]|nr:hypothetical protein [Candidatus Norongarragalinales archaeon]
MKKIFIAVIALLLIAALGMAWVKGSELKNMVRDQSPEEVISSLNCDQSLKEDVMEARSAILAESELILGAKWMWQGDSILAKFVEPIGKCGQQVRR